MKIDYKEFIRLEKSGFEFDWGVNCRPDRKIIAKYLKKFPFAMAQIDQGSIDTISGVIPSDYTYEQFRKWVEFSTKIFTSCDEFTFSAATGKFCFWWD